MQLENAPEGKSDGALPKRGALARGQEKMLHVKRNGFVYVCA
jgi:hypothetical protein